MRLTGSLLLGSEFTKLTCIQISLEPRNNDYESITFSTTPSGHTISYVWEIIFHFQVRWHIRKYPESVNVGPTTAEPIHIAFTLHGQFVVLRMKTMFKSMFYYAGLFKHNQTICAAYENPTSTNLCPISKSLLPRPAFVFHFICDEETELTVNQMMSEWKLSNVQWFFHSSWPHLVSIRSTVNARHCSNTLRQKFTC